MRWLAIAAMVAGCGGHQTHIADSKPAHDRRCTGGPAVITGTVIASDGKSLPSATIIAVGSDKCDRSAATDTAGRFRIQVPPGAYDVRAYFDSATEHHRIKVAADATAATTFRLRLKPPPAFPTPTDYSSTPQPPWDFPEPKFPAPPKRVPSWPKPLPSPLPAD